MNLLSKLVVVILIAGLASIAITSGLNQRDEIATSYGGDSSQDVIANPSGLSQFNSTDMNEGIPTANTTSFEDGGAGGIGGAGNSGTGGQGTVAGDGGKGGNMG